jgi:hypothetical protein
MSKIITENLQINGLNIKVSNDGGDVSSNGGIVLINKFLKGLKFDEEVNRIFKDKSDSRKYFKYSYSDILKQMIFQIMLGYKSDYSANKLKNDKLLSICLDNKIASSAGVSRFINSFT